MKLWNTENSTEITYFEPSNKITDAAIVIFPGGGYSMRAEHEGRGYAEFFQANGIPSFVVDYHVAPDYFPQPLLDARRAMRFVRFNAEKFGINPDKIAAMGSSAGGHLTAFLSTYTEKIDGEGVDELDKINPVPNAQILCYAVTLNDLPDDACLDSCSRNLFGKDYKNIRDKYEIIDNVTEDTPQAFFWHTFDDPTVDIENLLRYASALHKKNVPAEIHVYPHGSHGLGLCKDFPHNAQWTRALLNWLEYIGLVIR